MNSRLLLLSMLFLAGLPTRGSAATITECQELLRTGRYAECLDQTADAIERRSYGEEWPILKIRAERQLGLYSQALETAEAGLSRYSWSIRIRMEAIECYRSAGENEKASQMLIEIDRMVSSAPWRYTDADDLVALGKAAILLGADAKDVLEGFYDRARRNYQTRPDGYVASGELAIEKGDFQLAAEYLTPAADSFADNPDVLFNLSEAVRTSDAERSAELLQQTLEINSQYAPALLRLAEQSIDGEAYADAEKILAQILKVNPWNPQAHALQAVIHHLQSDPVEESRSRSLAMTFHPSSPEVDYLIGMKLSRKYRFAEGAEYQQSALRSNPDYLPARIQLAQDLLRLGQTQQGWQLAEQAHNSDGYNTTLFNLLQLRDSLDRFTTITNDRFVVRMSKSEAQVYGERVLELLDKAHLHLSQKYGYTPAEPVVVEIFDRQDDFAVRTFGIPDVAGFLGVCFGRLITANSPASQRQNPTNWESVLWHEFCHVITLQMTGNRIPRWLSEGLSVYEERQRDARWGQQMTPAFQSRILNGNITPVSDLSSAFLKATSGEDLNFAYYESSMVVEFLVQQSGHEILKNILADLNNGLTINDALERHAGGLDVLDAAFEQYLTKLASDFAQGVEFETEPFADGQTDLAEFAAENPANYPAGLMLASQQLKAEQYADAEQNLQRLITLFPQDDSGNSARRLLAELYRRQDRFDDQAKVLSEHLSVAGDDFDATAQLLELQVQQEDWSAATATGKLLMAIDPLRPVQLRRLVTVAMKTEEVDLAVRCLQGLLELDPTSAADSHFQIARLVASTNPVDARRHVLLALEQAPRFREAHRLLLGLTPVQTQEPLPSANDPEADAARN